MVLKVTGDSLQKVESEFTKIIESNAGHQVENNNPNESQVSMFDGIKQSTKNPSKLYFDWYFNEKCLFDFTVIT